MKTVTDDTVTNPDTRHERLTGKYLIFVLDNEEFAIEILKINQIIRLQEIIAIPRTPPFIRGIINLRGMIIPIIDLRKKFSMADHPDTERTCIVVIQLTIDDSPVNIGIVIDEVREVLEIHADCIEPTPEFGKGIDTAFITGIAKIGKTVKVILDIFKILTSDDVRSLSTLADNRNPDKRHPGTSTCIPPAPPPS